VRERNTFTLLVRISAATMESNMEESQKTKTKATIWSSDTTPRHISKRVCFKIW
jgi:hypothetical protein